MINREKKVVEELEPKTASTHNKVIEDSWAIRPCFLYKEEYNECSSFKARFHQYFIHGEMTDCSQWNQDYKNCLKYENDENIEAGKAIIKSEEERRKDRMKYHFANDIWKKRAAPPSDWNKPLPDWLVKRNENTFLELKSKELDGTTANTFKEKYICIIM